MFRSNRSLTKLTLTAAVALLAACSAADQVAAPKQSRVARPAGAPSLDVIMNAVAPDSMSADFTVTPSGGLFTLGNHAVYFPANSICDPETSGYGPELWNAPCQPLDRSIDFHAEIRAGAGGATWIDFSPAVRFVPSEDPNQTVWILMKAGADITEGNYQGFALKWMPNGNPEEVVDESLTDASLVTYVDLERDIVFRRVKHFSGYINTGAIVESEDLNSLVSIVW